MALPAIELSVRIAAIGPAEHVITLAGELDLYSASQLEDAIASALEEGARTVILDLLGVTFLDSSGLAVITAGAKRARAASGDLVLVTDRHDVLRVIKITGLDRFLTVHPSLAPAMDELIARTR